MGQSTGRKGYGRIFDYTVESAISPIASEYTNRTGTVLNHHSTSYNDFTLDEITQQIRRLQAEIDQQRAVAAELEAEVHEIETELEVFTVRYDQVLAALNRLEAAKKAIEELEHQRRIRAMMRDTPRARRRVWEPPAGYVPVEEQIRRNRAEAARRLHAEADPTDRFGETSAADTALDLDAELKRLYRKLARRWHPDLATDEADTRRRNEIMALVNTAYENRALETLLALDAEEDPTRPKTAEEAAAELPLAVLRLRQLQQAYRELARRIESLRQEHFDLTHNALMDIKIEATLAAAQGRDLLQEIIDRSNTEYWQCMNRLDELRKDA